MNDTSSDHSSRDADADGDAEADVPFLPPSVPSDGAGDAWQLPRSVPSDADRPWRTESSPSGPPAVPSVSGEFDARAMVEAQKSFAVNPAYGAIPGARSRNSEATQHLRREGRRKRRRNRYLRMSVGLVVVVVLALVAWFGYGAYQDYQDDLVDEGPTALVVR